MAFKKFNRRYTTSKRRHKIRTRRFGNHPFIVPVVVFLVLFIFTYAGYIYLPSDTFRPSDAHIVRLFIDDNHRIIPTKATTVGDLLNRLAIKLNEKDVVEPAVDTPILEDNFRINVYRARPVVVVDGDKKIYSISAALTPRTIAEQSGLIVYAEDSATPSPIDNVLQDGIGKKIVIERAVPITLNLYGTAVSSRSRAKTVGELLKEKNIQPRDGETVAPAKTTKIVAGQQVFVLQKGAQMQNIQEDIAVPVQTVLDASLSFGTTAIRQKGVVGKKNVTYILKADGSKQIIQEIIIQPAIVQIVARGQAIQIPDDKTSLMAMAGIAPSDYAYVNYIMSRESGWCPTKLQGQIGYCPEYAPEHIPSGLGYGLGQATPGTKMALFGADWRSDPVTQLRWAKSYTSGRYGSWEAAYNYWQSHHNW